MANKIYIQDFKQEEDPLIIPLLEDVQIELASNYSSFAESVPGISGLFSMLTALAATSGGASSSLVDTRTVLDSPRWDSTDPLRITVKLVFTSGIDSTGGKKTTAKETVYDPIMKLASYSILTKDPNNPNRFLLPGISLAASRHWRTSANETNTTAAQRTQADERNAFSNARLLTVQIPGMLYLRHAMVEKATPTFSKEKTVEVINPSNPQPSVGSGYPLWGTLELTLRSTSPATDQMFTDVHTIRAVKKIGGGNIGGGLG